MKRYVIEIFDGFGTITFESDSRNAMKHAKAYGAIECNVKNKHGFVISCVRYSDEFGYYYSFV